MTTIDLRSDTVTKPTAAMREAAATADVGDDVYGDDPTVNELERRSADLVGTEDALFVPSGTMGNLIAARVHTDRGDELICDREAHIFRWELGGAAQLAALQTRPIDCGERAVPTREQVEAELVERSLHRPATGLLALENTHNYRGGTAIPTAHLEEAAEAAHDHGVPVHLDGARLFNAAVALDTDPATLAASADSINFCLSKGLGAPIGSILAGTEPFIAEARRTRKLLGGGMRQVGVIAGPGLESLDSIGRLADDHENAARLAAGLREIDGIATQEPDTNIVMVNTEDAGLTAEEFVTACSEKGVLSNPFAEYTTRFTTHRDVDREDIDAAVDRVRQVVSDLS